MCIVLVKNWNMKEISHLSDMSCEKRIGHYTEALEIKIYFDPRQTYAFKCFQVCDLCINWLNI